MRKNTYWTMLLLACAPLACVGDVEEGFESGDDGAADGDGPMGDDGGADGGTGTGSDVGDGNGGDGTGGADDGGDGDTGDGDPGGDTGGTGDDGGTGGTGDDGGMDPPGDCSESLPACYEPPRHVEVGQLPSSLVARDLNGMGGLDLAVSNVMSTDVAILTEQSIDAGIVATNFHVDQGAYHTFIVNFDADDTNDVIAAASGDDRLDVFVNIENNNFNFVGSIPLEGWPTCMATKDMNDDGISDLLVCLETAQQLAVIELDGDGSILDQTTVPTVNEPVKLLVVDVIGDANTEIVVSSGSDGGIQVLPVTADGSLGSPTTLAAGHAVRGLAVADFNGDGGPDLAAARPADDLVTIYHGNGTLNDGIDVSTDASPWRLAAADLDDDGASEIMIAARDADRLQLLGFVDGSYTDRGGFDVGAQPIDVVAGDINDDGVADLATANLAGNTVSVILSLP